MQREIKFRVWREDLKRFLHYHELYQLKINPLFSLVWSGQTGHGADISPEKFQQFTGLKDKNEKEIYEGDIVKFSFGGETDICEVVCDKYMGLKTNNGGWTSIVRIDTHGEVIGNIFENPSLIK